MISIKSPPQLEDPFYWLISPASRAMVTLAGYCVHSTLVPAIVPFFFFAPSEKIHMKKSFLSNGRGCAGKRGKEVHDRLQIHHHSSVRRFFFESPPHQQPLSKPPFLHSVCGFSFFWFGFFGVRGVLQCSTSPIRWRIG